ncbi:MAG: shikimate kinase, partial [Woeseia sp.]
TYRRLLMSSHSIWLKATPEEHMSRVMAQGDFRPMGSNPAAMADLKAILDAREGDYARADATFDTSEKTVPEAVDGLVRVAEIFLGGRN